jgi:hypothetical protein
LRLVERDGVQAIQSQMYWISLAIAVMMGFQEPLLVPVSVIISVKASVNVVVAVHLHQFYRCITLVNRENMLQNER